MLLFCLQYYTNVSGQEVPADWSPPFFAAESLPTADLLHQCELPFHQRDIHWYWSGNVWAMEVRACAFTSDSGLGVISAFTSTLIFGANPLRFRPVHAALVRLLTYCLSHRSVCSRWCRTWFHPAFCPPTPLSSLSTSGLGAPTRTRPRTMTSSTTSSCKYVCRECDAPAPCVAHFLMPIRC